MSRLRLMSLKVFLLGFFAMMTYQAALAQDSAVVSIADHKEGVVFPNNMFWSGSEKGTFPELATIFDYSHRLAVPALYSLVAGNLPTNLPQGVNTDPAANAQTARMSYGILRQMAIQQNSSELVFYYDEGKADLPVGSMATKKLDEFAQALSERVDSKHALLLIVVGSNQSTGVEGKLWSLARLRATEPAKRLSSELQGVPQFLVAVAGVNAMYSNPAQDTKFETRDRYTRITPILIPRKDLEKYQSSQAAQVAQQPVYSPSMPTQPAYTAPSQPIQPIQPIQPMQPQSYQQPESTVVVRQESPTQYVQPLRQPIGERQTTISRGPSYQQTQPQTSALPAPQSIPASMNYAPTINTAPSPPPIFQNEFGMTFAYIPPGSFMMGSPEDELRRDKDERLHQVTLTDGFYMQTTELTLSHWKEVTGSKPAHFENWAWDYPVENVSWVEVDEFIKKLNERSGGKHYRLPTEAEWEYACRAGTTTAFYNVEMQPGEKGQNEKLGAYAWYFHNSDHRTHRVAQKEPNAWGLYDMHGNVWEWCNDWLGSYPFDPIVDPIGPPQGNAKIRRGGSYTDFPAFARSADRSWHHFKERSPHLGFRLVRDLLPATEQKAAPAAAMITPSNDPCEYRGDSNGMMVVRKGIPNSNVQGTVYVERETPPVVVAGEPYEYKLHVYNNTGCDLYSATITEFLPAGFALRGTKREADQKAGNSLIWRIQPMPAGSSETFTIMGMATGSQELQHCAIVDFSVQSCATVSVVKPMLAIDQDSAVNSLLICEQVPLNFRITNSGTGTAGDVQVRVTLPNGLQTSDGQRELSVQMGNLAAGASQDVNLMARATAEGTYRVVAAVSGSGGLQATASRTVTVKAPRLRITSTARATQYSGRPVDYNVTVTNVGTAASQNVTVMGEIPQGMSFVNASDGGGLQQNQVAWQIASLAPNQSVTVSYSLQTAAAGTFSSTATAIGQCADQVTAAAQTSVQGIAAILLEVADERDPLEVGETGTYIIVATNQGSMASTNVRITCELEANLSFVSGTGASELSPQTRGNMVVFNPLERLEPGARAVWRVSAKALTAGDVRFKTQLNSDQLQRPVEETEATTLY